MRWRVVVLGVAMLAATATQANAATSSATDPAHRLMASINQARTARGLVPLRSDPNLWAIAGERAGRLAASGILSHEAAGSLPQDLAARSVRWFGYGEDIGYASGSASEASAAILGMWAASSDHWPLLMSARYNYLGVGLAARSSSGVTFASVVLTESPDRTGAQAAVAGALVSGNDIRWSWRGSDVPLQTHTVRPARFHAPAQDGSGCLGHDRHRADRNRPIHPQPCPRTLVWPAGSRSRPGRQRRTVVARAPRLASLTSMSRRHPFAAVNLISDPIHGYVELTKRLTPAQASSAGLATESVAEEDLLDTAWLQRLRRISQLQSARWVFPTAEHSRFTHGLGVMHEAGLWARSLYPSLRRALVSVGAACPSEGLVVETLRMAGLLHDVGHGPFAHFFDDHVLAQYPAPADPRRPPGKRLTHEDLSQRIIEDELGSLIQELRRAPGADPERDALATDEVIDPAWVSYLIAKPALADPDKPRWVRWLQPLLSGVFTVDNLDYVRRDAYLTGVAVGPVDVERLRRYTFISEQGLTIYEPGLAALEMFLTARRFMYQQVYFHRTVRAIDLDLADVFGELVRAIFGDGSPAERLTAYADLDEYALLHQAARWARGEDVVGPGTDAARPGNQLVSRSIAEAWRSILLRRPNWRSEAEVRAEYEAGHEPQALIDSLGTAEPGRVAIDLAIVDARPTESVGAEPRLAIEMRDGTPGPTLAEALGRLPGYALIGRRYRRTGG